MSEKQQFSNVNQFVKKKISTYDKLLPINLQLMFVQMLMHLISYQCEV